MEVHLVVLEYAMDELLNPGNIYFWILVVGLITIIVFIIKGKIKMLMVITSFMYPNAKLHAMGNDYVKQDELEALLESRRFADAINLMSTKNYPVKDVKDINKAESILDKYNIESIEHALIDCPQSLKPLLKAYLKKYEVSMIKKALKSKLFREKNASIQLEPSKNIHSVGGITSDIIATMMETERSEEIAEMFAQTPFGKELKEAIQEYDGNFQKIENLLDKYVFSELKNSIETVEPSVNVPVKQFVNQLTDITNIKILLRAKFKKYSIEDARSSLLPPGRSLPAWKLEQMCEANDITELLAEIEGTPYITPIRDALPDYEKSRSISPLEIALDRFLLSRIVDLSVQYTITAGPMIRYIVSKEYEVRNLKTVLRGLSEELPENKITPLLITETTGNI
jgi:V/A-type H+-transporting ATPase subunit C